MDRAESHCPNSCLICSRVSITTRLSNETESVCAKRSKDDGFATEQDGDYAGTISTGSKGGVGMS